MAGEGKEIVETVTLSDCKDNVEDDNGIADARPVSSHSEAYSLINKLMMVGGTSEDDCDPISLQLVHRLQQKAAIKRFTKLTQRRVTSFFC